MVEIDMFDRKVRIIINSLLKIKESYPNLSNDEILKVMELKIMMESNARGRR